MRANVKRPSYGTLGSSAMPNPPLRQRPRCASADGMPRAASARTNIKHDFLTPRSSFLIQLMRHRVHEIVHAELVRLIGQLNGHEPRVRPFPIIPDVIV